MTKERFATGYAPIECLLSYKEFDGHVSTRFFGIIITLLPHTLHLINLENKTRATLTYALLPRYVGTPLGVYHIWDDNTELLVPGSIIKVYLRIGSL